MDTPFLIRSVRDSDLDQLHRLSQMVYFINLPDDREILQQKIGVSIASFTGEIEDKFSREYILVMENPEDGTIVGSSMVIARHGSPSSPHMYLQLREVHKYSETIHFGLIHKVLRLRFDTDGPTEIGGLVMHPNYRKHKDKLGRQLSYSRFLFIKMKRRSFKNYILSELMPPLTESGESVLWDSLGRRFTNLSYEEADVLSRKNKEFVTSLFPQEDIYTCLLSGEARDAIGKVGKGAEPVKHMLESIGFRWKEHIDPFDGGPHYWAETDKISIVKDTRKYHVHREPLKRKSKNLVLVGTFYQGEYRACQTPVEIARGGVHLPKIVWETLQVSGGDSIYIMPFDSP
jgi:arginine N-succinyltransferase